MPAAALPPPLRWLILTDNQIEALPAALGQLHAAAEADAGGQPPAVRCRTRWPPADALELLRISANRLDALPDWLLSLPRLAWLAFAGNPVRRGARSTRRSPRSPAAAHRLARALAAAQARRRRFRRDPPRRTGGSADGSIQPVAVKLFKGAVTSDGWPHSEMAACIAAGAHPDLIAVLGRVDEPSRRHAGPGAGAGDAALSQPGRPAEPASCTRDVYADDARWPVDDRAGAWRAASPRPRRNCMRAASCTATSTPTTSCGTARATACWATSAPPRSCRGRRRAGAGAAAHRGARLRLSAGRAAGAHCRPADDGGDARRLHRCASCRNAACERTPRRGRSFAEIASTLAPPAAERRIRHARALPLPTARRRRPELRRAAAPAPGPRSPSSWCSASRPSRARPGKPACGRRRGRRARRARHRHAALPAAAAHLLLPRARIGAPHPLRRSVLLPGRAPAGRGQAPFPAGHAGGQVRAGKPAGAPEAQAGPRRPGAPASHRPRDRRHRAVLGPARHPRRLPRAVRRARDHQALRGDRALARRARRCPRCAAAGSADDAFHAHAGGATASRTPRRTSSCWMQRDGWARLRLRRVTGRRHQLRVHCAALGMPIRNDAIYPELRPKAATTSTGRCNCWPRGWPFAIRSVA